jgi:hypothetical protein
MYYREKISEEGEKKERTGRREEQQKTSKNSHFYICSVSCKLLR